MNDGCSRVLSDSKQMADLLQKQFCAVFSNPLCNIKKDPDFAPTAVSLEVKDIKTSIDEIRITSAPGEDEIPAILLKSCKDA